MLSNFISWFSLWIRWVLSHSQPCCYVFACSLIIIFLICVTSAGPRSSSVFSTSATGSHRLDQGLPESCGKSLTWVCGWTKISTLTQVSVISSQLYPLFINQRGKQSMKYWLTIENCFNTISCMSPYAGLPHKQIFKVFIPGNIWLKFKEIGFVLFKNILS